ncbi:unnamed protein product [Allacma fusca]|uniref:Peptidase M12B domain-containing protein n=1 Tax=Allacma fusca TaxID=39272 RepID=A0A8J2K3T8_9HEXA|nr:unnamed protein product [Allacma fusca]
MFIGIVPLSANRHITDRGKHLKQGQVFFESKPKSSCSACEERIVELAIFADQSYLDIVKKKLSTKSSKVIRGFICVLVEAMALLYRDESMKTKIAFKIVRMEFFSKTPSSIVTHHGLLTPYLKSFCKYATDHTETHSWDHAMLLTNTDLRDEYSNNPIGTAFTGGCCVDYGGCSIIESTNLQAAFVMAHEVGHSLGMGHDGENKNIQCKKGEHLMSPLLGRGQLKWSSCSNKNLEDYLEANENSRFTNVRRGCLKSLTGTSEKSYSFMTDKLPGERFTLNQQCYIFDTKRPVAVTNDILGRFRLQGDICGKMYCTDASKMYAVPAHPPLEGTVCASGKQCRNGECKTVN